MLVSLPNRFVGKSLKAYLNVLVKLHPKRKYSYEAKTGRLLRKMRKFTPKFTSEPSLQP